nr:class I SAM-dependent methyltransferase [Ruegeria sp. ANG-S4]
MKTTDYSAPNVDFHCDITDIPEADESYDLILCSHVMEHIVDDQAAYQELCRILRPDGCMVIQVPYARDEAVTDEDASVTDPAERERRWGQFDHVRRYGKDIVDRMARAGLTCEVLPLSTWIHPADMERFELWDDVVFECQKKDKT